MSQLNIHLPVRTSNPIFQSPARHATITAITRFYLLLTKLPYIPPSALMLPPLGGWRGIDEAELKRRGKTDSVISVLRELPYLNQENDEFMSEWSLAYNTLHINYARGNMYERYFEDELLPVPGHVIWLSFGYERAGCYWLLDTQTWEIVEYTLMGDSIETPWDIYEGLPTEERWKHYTRMPADLYFDLWRQRYESLEFIIMRENSPGFRMDHFHAKDPMLLWEESLEDTDEEDQDFVPVSVDEAVGERSAMSDESSDEESEIEDMEWDMVEDINELNDLIRDTAETAAAAAPANSTQEAEIHLPTNSSRDGNGGYGKSALFMNSRIGRLEAPDADLWNDPRQIRQRNDIKELVEIFHQNGWPKYEQLKTVGYTRNALSRGHVLDLNSFNREQCGKELNEWMRSRRRKSRERSVRRATEMVKGFKRDVLVARHQLQRALLTHQDPMDDTKLQELSSVLDSLEPIKRSPEDVLVDTNIYKVLNAIVHLPWLQEDDRFGIHRKAQEIVDCWKEREMLGEG